MSPYALTFKTYKNISYSAWIEESNIKPYLEYKDTLIKSSKSGAFKDAVEAIEEFIANGEVSYLIIESCICMFLRLTKIKQCMNK